MNDLVDVLRSQAEVIRPHPDLEDVLRRARDRRRRTVGLRATGVAVVVAAVTLGVGASMLQSDDQTDVAASGRRGLPGLALGPLRRHVLDREDLGASRGPWTAVVRRAGGSLGSGGAVVTFPVPALAYSGPRVTVRGTAGISSDRQVVWPIAGGYARVRGDLGPAELIRIAARTSIVHGRPRVGRVTGLTVVFTGPYRAPLVHEARYGSAPLGESASLGNGLTYTGVLRAGGFEDRLFAVRGRLGLRVRGHPAVLSSVQGGNDTLAWELAPGVIAYVGYSGNSLSADAARALTRLADRSHVVSMVEWQTGHSQVVEQSNDFA